MGVLHIQSTLSKLLQYQTEMFFLTLRVDQYVIDEHHDELVQILHKKLVHHIHKVCWGISQSKRHHRILI
jgi:hypothetical protein